MRRLVPLFLLVLFSGVSHAQKPVYDPFRWINDPLAIADLGGPDSTPMMRLFDAFTMKQTPRDFDGKIILAADTGVGIIRHFWAVIVHQEPHPWFRLWVDDSLLIDAPDSEFFTKAHGFIRAPLDSANMGGFVCESQIPYKHSFRWTCDYTWFVRHCVWQRLDTSNYSLPSMGSAEYTRDLASAEKNYFLSDPWGSGDSVQSHLVLQPGQFLAIPVIHGPAFISDVHLDIRKFDTTALRSLWLVIRWDGDPRPAVEVPVADFYGVNRVVRSLESFRITVDTASHSLDCYFPMPFRVSADVRVENRGADDADVDLIVRHAPLAWNRHYGYFSAQYHLTQATMRDVLHPVLRVLGSGRYIGTNFSFANSAFAQAVFMEGDGYFSVDSTSMALTGLSPDYSGTEDYCNSGWYFNGITFNHPFSGNSAWGNMYRLHFTDPYNYSKSLDIRWGHGFENDYKETIGTVAYYYQEWKPFDLSSDTVVKGNLLHVVGSGFGPSAEVGIRRDNVEVARAVANRDGDLDAMIPVLSTWSVGEHFISIEGLAAQRSVVVLDRPVVTFLHDTAGQIYGEGDSILIRGYGFKPHERIRLSASAVDTSATFAFSNDSILADSDGVFRLQTHLPWLPQRSYRLHASGESNDQALSDSSFYVTRVLNYEFEDLPIEFGSAEYAYIRSALGWYSQAAIRFCNGAWNYGTKVGFTFEVPFTDTFAVRVFSITGNRYANYRMLVDGRDCGAKDWFLDAANGVISRDSADLGSVYLTKGIHDIQFVNEGYHDNGIEYSVGPDNMHLTPLSSTTSDIKQHVPIVKGDVLVYPNPTDGRGVTVENLPVGTMWISLVDGAGRELQTTSVDSGASTISLSLPSPSSSVYWLRIHTPYNVITRAIVIAR